MTNPKGKRNKIVIALFFPALIFLWIVGWSLYWIGHQREPRKPKLSSFHKEKDNVNLEAIAIDELLETESCKN